jgi:hypothetical protein
MVLVGRIRDANMLTYSLCRISPCIVQNIDSDCDHLPRYAIILHGTTVYAMSSPTPIIYCCVKLAVLAIGNHARFIYLRAHLPPTPSLKSKLLSLQESHTDLLRCIRTEICSKDCRCIGARVVAGCQRSVWMAGEQTAKRTSTPIHPSSLKLMLCP